MPSTRTLGFLLMIVALLPLSRSAQIYNAQQSFIAASDALEGTVVDLQPVPGKAEHKQRLAIVEFVGSSGALLRAPTNVASYPAPQAIGDVISVRVSRLDETDVRIASITGLWFECLFYLIPGSIALLCGLWMVRRGKGHKIVV